VLKWKCPNGHEITRGLVCGGETPPGHDDVEGNIWFYMDLETEEFSKEVWTDLPFDLTDDDWDWLHDHCAGGCCSEPLCPECQQDLDEVEVPDSWLDEANRIRDEHSDPFHYCNNNLGTPKYDNGFDQLYFQDLSPLEALEKWRDYAPEN